MRCGGGHIPSRMHLIMVVPLSQWTRPPALHLWCSGPKNSTPQLRAAELSVAGATVGEHTVPRGTRTTLVVATGGDSAVVVHVETSVVVVVVVVVHVVESLSKNCNSGTSTVVVLRCWTSGTWLWHNSGACQPPCGQEVVDLRGGSTSGGSDDGITTMCLIITPHEHAPNSGGRTPGSKLPASPPPLPRPDGGGEPLAVYLCTRP